MSITGAEDDSPTPVGTTVVDAYAAMQIITSILAALYERERTGKGRRIDVDMFSSSLHLLSQELVVAVNSGEPATRSTTQGLGHVYLQAPYGVYETADGYLVLSFSPVDVVADALDIDSLRDVRSLEQAYQEREDTKQRIESVLQSRSTEHRTNRLLEADVWCAPVRDLANVPEDPQVRANDVIRSIPRDGRRDPEVMTLPFRFDGTTPAPGSPPPRVGEHTRELLAALGFSERFLEN